MRSVSEKTKFGKTDLCLPHFIYKRSAGSISAASFSIWMSLKQETIQFVIMCSNNILNCSMGRDFRKQYKASQESPQHRLFLLLDFTNKRKNDTELHKAFLI